jgi:hypothetical protein
MKDSLGNEIVLGKKYGSFIRMKYVENIPHVIVGIAQDVLEDRYKRPTLVRIKLETTEVREYSLETGEYSALEGDELDNFKYKNSVTLRPATLFPIEG